MKKILSQSKRSSILKEILCTLGPSSMNERVIKRLEDTGVSLFRINLSHTGLEELSDIIRFMQSKTSVPICIDTEGAQIRTGTLKERKIILPDNGITRILKDKIAGDSQGFNLYPYDVVDKFKAGDFISMDFNSVLAQIIDKDKKGLDIRILTGGLVGQNKAVTVDRDIKLPPLTEKDCEAIKIGIEKGIRHFALSFANRASDVDVIRSLAGEKIFLISKIESVDGIINLEEISKKSDAILIDRGDLSRQVSIERIPILQKDIISRVKKLKIKVYVATNLLESMVTSSTPTRAEVNDIFNTLNDGADGLVLAAETAIGSYPVDCATMVCRIIKEFSNFKDGYSIKELETKDSFLLLEPHGGILINRMKSDIDIKEIIEYKSIEVDEINIMDAEQIALGTFSPLEGFMNKKEIDAVLKNYRLPDGTIWPIPIFLQIDKKQALKMKEHDKIALILKNTKDIYGILHLEDIYEYDLDRMAMEMFGTNSMDHPGVRALKRRGSYFLGGKIDMIRRLPSAYKHFEITPRQTRSIFESKGWSRVVGFHTRNVVHRVHEYIQILGFESYNCDGLFIHPVIGPKKEGDYSAGVILKSYELMIDRHYPKSKAVLGAFQNHSRYSGPREAVFTALCRKNFGCSHFIVGRDHTGVSNYYKPDDAHKLFDYLGDIGIVPIFFDAMHYCKECRAYVSKCVHENKHIAEISGTEGREIFKSKQLPPEWFMRKDISELVLSEIKKGSEVFVQ